jgi:hypothetical protein
VIGSRRCRQTRPLSSEQALHATVAQFLHLALRPPTTWSTFPAGGGGLQRGRILARLGLRAGWPDILVLHPTPTEIEGRKRTIVLGLELKNHIGRQSQVQRAIEADFAAAGATYFLCRTVEDTYAALRAAGVPMHAIPLGAAS